MMSFTMFVKSEKEIGSVKNSTAYIYTYTHIYIHTYIHTQTHIYIF